MTTMTKYSDISPRTTVYAAAQMLNHAEPILVLNKLGQTKPIPKTKVKPSNSVVLNLLLPHLTH